MSNKNRKNTCAIQDFEDKGDEERYDRYVKNCEKLGVKTADQIEFEECLEQLEEEEAEFPSPPKP